MPRLQCTTACWLVATDEHTLTIEFASFRDHDSPFVRSAWLRHPLPAVVRVRWQSGRLRKIGNANAFDGAVDAREDPSCAPERNLKGFFLADGYHQRTYPS